MKKVFNIIFWIIILSCIIYALYFVNERQSNTKCTEFTINIDNNFSEPMISVKNIRKEINKIIDTLQGEKISNIPIKKIEKVLNKNPFIEKADVFSTLKGKLQVNILQKHPIIRITNTKNKSIYIDKNGSVIPAGKSSPARVLIANGNISTPLGIVSDTNLFRYKTLKDIFEIAKYIHYNKFLKAQIEQIYITKSGEFELIPKLGNHIIKFGNINKMEMKFKKLIAFYINGNTNDDLIKYKTLDLKFKNQVVCSK